MPQATEVRIPQGSTTRVAIPIDTGGASIAGWTAKAQVRPNVDSGTVLAEFSTALGTITISSTQVAVDIAAEVSAEWTFAEGVWDLELTTLSGTQRLTQGKFTVDREVTR